MRRKGITKMKKYNINVNGNSFEVMVEEVSAEGATPVAAPAPVAAPKAAAPAPKAAPAAPKAQTGAAGAVKVTSPMPGTILEVKVSVGQAVKKGDVVCVLEAMKMENEIPAPEDGTVASVNIQKGASVNAGDLLVSLN